MAPGRQARPALPPEPSTLAEAKEYIGRRFSKFFKETNSFYEGVVVDVDTEVETENGEEQGLFYRVTYPADGDGEHLLWVELVQLLAAAAAAAKADDAPGSGGDKRRAAKNKREGGPAAGEPSSKRRRSGQEQQQQRRRQHAAPPEDSDESMLDTEGEGGSGDELGEAGPPRRQGPKAGGAAERPGGRQRQQQRQQRRDGPPSDQDTAGGGGRRQGEEGGGGGGGGGGSGADAAEQEQEEEEEPVDAAALERLLAEGANPVVSVRAKGLAGHLKGVNVVNFMCHANFAMDFGTHVNVVSGSNGSGKSAVLQAMQCALGVQARNTGRGDNLRQFVRSGSHEAKVQVSLWNTGEDAFRPTQYGEWLTVERTIRLAASGSVGTSWRLLDCQGRKVSGSRRDVDDLLDHLSIDAGNPLAVMTQDTARNFLCGAVADRKKFDLFMEATMLAAWQGKLRLAEGRVQEMDASVSHIKADHSARKQRVAEIRARLSKLAESAGLARERAAFERAQLWAAVLQVEDTRDKCLHRLQVDLPQWRAAEEEALAEVEAQLARLQAEEASLAQDNGRMEVDQTAFTQEVRSLGNSLKAARGELRAKHQAYDAARAALAGLQDELNALLEAKRASSADRQREFDERMGQYRQKLEAAQAQQRAAEEARRQQEEELGRLREALRAKQQDIGRLQNVQRNTLEAIHRMEADLRSLNSSKGEKLALFGKHRILRELVDREIKLFDQPPIGPLGVHLALKDPGWQVAAEGVLGPHLDKWIVTSNRDEQSLRRLARTIPGFHPVVLVASFGRPPYSIPPARRVREGWSSLRQFVAVEHPTFAHIIDNKLMDMAQYERVVVDHDWGRCNAAVYNRAAGDCVTVAVDSSGRRLARKATTVRNDDVETRGPPRIGASHESALAHVRQALAQQEAVFEQQRAELTAANVELQQLQSDDEAKTNESMTSFANIKRAQAAITVLQTQMPVADVGDGEGEEGLLADTQRIVQEQLAAAQLAHDAAKEALDAAERKHEQCKQLQEARRAELEEMLSQMNARTEELERLAGQKAAIVTQRESTLKKIEVLQAKAAEAEKHVAAAEEALQSIREAAEALCTREEGAAAMADARECVRVHMDAMAAKKAKSMDPQKRAEAVDKAVETNCGIAKAPSTYKAYGDRLDKQIASAEQDAGGNKVELESQLAVAEAEVAAHDRSVRHMVDVVRISRRLLQERWRKYDEAFDSVVSTVSGKFMAYMHRRGHQGRVVVDQDAGELRLLVKVNVQAAGGKAKPVRDLKQLSGGERSFTTVAFILALGEFTESPFRALDEFDVFMDAVNRRIAMQTLLEFAREKGHLQFVLLTPQDLQAVEDAKRKLEADRPGQPLAEGFVKVVQMKPARS